MMMILLQSSVTIRSAPLVQAPWGALQGISVQGDGGRKVNGYLGIPYAVPPVGELRFEKPLPHPGPGAGKVFEANKVMPPCPQRTILIGETRKTSEDCLMLDVYVPAEENSEHKPYAVMVWIHGGTLVWGDAHSYRPSKLVTDGQVIVVIIQYRLGVLGFLTSGDGTLQENLGLWDQNLALRWVHDNIQAFGGDPGRVTIFGVSAGGWSVGMHLVIPQSRGLFQRAIMQSGAPQDLFRFMDHYDKRSIFKGLTELVGCQGESSRQLLQCLKEQPVDRLMEKSVEYEKTSPIHSFYFPVVDGDLVPQSARELAQDSSFLQHNVGDVDVLLGFTKQEGTWILLNQHLLHFPQDVFFTTDFFQKTVDACFTLFGLGDHAILKKTTEFFYRGADSHSNISQSLDPLVDMYGDCIFNVAITEWVRYLASAPHSASRYMYVVDHDFACNTQGPVTGAHHGDELMLEFDLERDMPDDVIFKVLNRVPSDEEKNVLSPKFIDILTTFAKTGNPSAPIKKDLGGEDWPQFTTEEQQYLSFSRSPRVVSQLGPYRDRVALWLNLLPQLQALLDSYKLAAEQKEGKAREEL